MISKLKEKLLAYILTNNPDLGMQLQSEYSITQYVEDKIMSIMPILEGWYGEGKPTYVIEELAVQAMTKDLRPSRFNYIKQIVREEFTDDYERLEKAGILTYEVINLVAACREQFETFGFTEESRDNRFLRYAVIVEIHNHFN